MKRIVFWALAAAGLFLRFFELGKRSLWEDELTQVYAVQDGLATFWHRLAGEHLGPPLDFFLTMLALKFEKIAPFSLETLVRIPPALFSAAALVLLFRRFRNSLASFAAIALSFTLVAYAQEARMYSVFFLLSVLSWTAWEDRSWKLWTIANVLGLGTHYFFPLVLLPQLLFWRKEMFRGALIALLSALLLSPLFFAQLARVATDASNQYGLAPDLRFLPQILSGLFLPGRFAPFWPILAVLLAIGAFHVWKSRRPLVLWVVLSLAIPYLVSSRFQIATPRNFIFLIYPLAILLGAGLEWLALQTRRFERIISLILSAALIASLTEGLRFYVREVWKEDFRAAAARIAAEPGDGAVLLEQAPWFPPVYLARLGYPVERTASFALKNWRDEPRRAILLDGISIARPRLFLSRDVDPGLEREIVAAGRFRNSESLAGLTLYSDPEPRAPSTRLRKGISEIYVCRATSGKTYLTARLCCHDRNDPGYLTLEPEGGQTVSWRAAPGHGLFGDRFLPRTPFPYRVDVPLEMGERKIHLSWAGFRTEFVPPSPIPRCAEPRLAAP